MFKPSRFALFLLAVAAFALAAAAPSQALTVTVDGNTTFQMMDGWGACTYPNENSDSDSCYLWDSWRTAYREVGNNILRLNVEPNIFMADGGDLEGPELSLTGNLSSDAALFDFEFSRFRYSDDLAIWLSNNALEPDRVKINPSVWSVPHWAKAPTGAYISSGRWSGGTPLIMYCNTCDTAGGTWDTGIWQQDRYQYNAWWIAAMVYGFEQHSGVPVYSVALQNEAGYENPFNSCTLFHEASATKGTRQDNGTTTNYAVYANVLKAVKDNWPTALSHVKIMGPHHANVAETVANPWGLLMQMSPIQAVKDHADANLLDFLDIYTHNYGAGQAERAEMLAGYWDGIDEYPELDWGSEWGTPVFPQAMHDGIDVDGKPTWNSEMGGHGTNWAGALDLAYDLHCQIVYGHESGLIYWQFADPSVSEHCLLGEDQLDNPTQSPKYCSWKQFARHIRPGAERVSATFNSTGLPLYGGGSSMDGENGLNVSAYVHGADGRVTVVLVNMTTTGQSVDIVLPSSPSVSSCDVYRSSGTENYVYVGEAAVSSGVVGVSVPGESVVTVTGPATGGDTTPPAAPTNLTATAVSSSQIDLDWDDNTEGDLASYNVYRDGSPLASGVTSSDYSDTGLSASTQYCYTVTAVDTSDNESAESNQACATTQESGATTMHVANVVPRLDPLHGPRKHAAADVLILDEFDQPVAGATVYVTITLDGSSEWQKSGVTGANGWAMDIWATDGRYSTNTTCVTDVTHATLTYESDQNVETCDSI